MSPWSRKLKPRKITIISFKKIFFSSTIHPIKKTQSINHYDGINVKYVHANIAKLVAEIHFKLVDSVYSELPLYSHLRVQQTAGFIGVSF